MVAAVRRAKRVSTCRTPPSKLTTHWSSRAGSVSVDGIRYHPHPLSSQTPAPAARCSLPLAKAIALPQRMQQRRSRACHARRAHPGLLAGCIAADHALLGQAAGFHPAVCRRSLVKRPLAAPPSFPRRATGRRMRSREGEGERGRRHREEKRGGRDATPVRTSRPGYASSGRQAARPPAEAFRPGVDPASSAGRLCCTRRAWARRRWPRRWS